MAALRLDLDRSPYQFTPGTSCQLVLIHRQMQGGTILELDRDVSECTNIHVLLPRMQKMQVQKNLPVGPLAGTVTAAHEKRLSTLTGLTKRMESSFGDKTVLPDIKPCKISGASSTSPRCVMAQFLCTVALPCKSRRTIRSP